MSYVANYNVPPISEMAARISKSPSIRFAEIPGDAVAPGVYVVYNERTARWQLPQSVFIGVVSPEELNTLPMLRAAVKQVMEGPTKYGGGGITTKTWLIKGIPYEDYEYNPMIVATDPDAVNVVQYHHLYNPDRYMHLLRNSGATFGFAVPTPSGWVVHPDTTATVPAGPLADADVAFLDSLLAQRKALWWKHRSVRNPEMPPHHEWADYLLDQLLKKHPYTLRLDDTRFIRDAPSARTRWQTSGTYAHASQTNNLEMIAALREWGDRSGIDLALPSDLHVWRSDREIDRPGPELEPYDRSWLPTSISPKCYESGRNAVEHVIAAGILVFPIFLFVAPGDFEECEALVIEDVTVTPHDPPPFTVARREITAGFVDMCV